MTDKEYNQYYRPAFINVTGWMIGYGVPDLIAFGKIAISDPIGFDPWPSPFSPPLTERDRNRLTALAGPHGKAIFKMLEIQKGDT